MHARFTDIRFGQRLDYTHEAIRTLPLTPLSPPPSLEETTLNSAEVVSLDDSRDRHVRTTPSTPGEMSIDDPRDEEALGDVDEDEKREVGKVVWCGVVEMGSGEFCGGGMIDVCYWGLFGNEEGDGGL